MKKNKKGKSKKSKKAEISIDENIVVSEHVSYNSLLIDDIDFISRTLTLDANKFDLLTDTIKDRLESLGELEETESLRLQIALDRLGRFTQMLTNIMKKMSETESELVADQP